MQNLSKFFIILAILLSDAMCAVVGFNYADLLLGEKYAGYSAPPNTAFLLGIPFVLGIALCVFVSVLLRKKVSH